MVAGVAATRLKCHVRPGRAASHELEVAAVVVRALADDPTVDLELTTGGLSSAEVSLVHVVRVPRTNSVFHTSM